MKNQRDNSLVVLLTIALGLACTQSAAAQTFKAVTVNGNVPIIQIASGGVSVWALASNGNPYRYNGSTFALASSISLSQIAVGGGNAAQADTVWALNSSGNIFHASRNGTSWVFSQVPGSLDLIAVGPGYQDSCHPYEVWGLNTSSQIYRYNSCKKIFLPEPGILCDLHVGGGDIWGAQCGPNVFRFNFSTGVFDQISDPFGAFPVLTVGPGGVEWAIDTGTSDVYRYDDTVGFVNLGCCLTQIQANGNGVWGVASNNVYFWEPSAQGFKQIVGANLVSISVGSGGGVWGIDSANRVLKFTTP